MIPDEFFAAVAEVLAFVFRTAGRRRRSGRMSMTLAWLKSQLQNADEGPAVRIGSPSLRRALPPRPPAGIAGHTLAVRGR